MVGYTHFIIYKLDGNIIEDADAGLIVSTHQDPRSTSTSINPLANEIPLQIECNNFRSNNIGIVGSGDMADQVWHTAGYRDANNTFACFNWDIIWGHEPGGVPTSSFYYYHGSGATINGSGLSLTPIYINGVQKGVPSPLTNDFTILTSGMASSLCSPPPFADPTGLDTKTIEGNERAGVTVYPNPAQQLCHIKKDANNKADAIVVIDITGRVVYEGRFNADILSFDCSGFNNGVYLAQIKQGGNIISTIRFVKVD